MSRNSILDCWVFRTAGLLLGTSIALNAWAGDTSVTVGNASVTVTGSSIFMNFPVSRSGDLSYDAYLSFQTQDGTAVSGTDYAPAQGSWLLPAGVANLTIPVAVNGKNVAASDKTFSLNMIGFSTAAPNFALSPQQAFPAGSNPYVIAVADVNGDGKPDLIVADYDSGKVGVLLNTTAPGAPTPTFAAEQLFSVGSTTFAVAIADMNGDGKPDIIASDLSHGTISVLLNTTATTPGAPASFSAAQPFTAQSGSAASIAVADLNGDGKPDLVVGSNTNAVAVFINNTATNSTTVNLIPQSVTVGGNASSSFMYVATADLNGDGEPDLVVTDGVLNTVSVLLNTTPVGSQSPSFSATPLVLTTGNGPTMCAVADVNGDGKPDLIVANNVDGTLSVFINTTTPPGTNTPSFSTTPQVFTLAGNPRSVIAADVDGDGRLDLIVGYDASATNGISVLLNTAEPSAPAASFAAPQPFGTTNQTYYLAAADLNGDGRRDIIARQDNDNVIVFLNATTPGKPPTSDLSATSLPFGNQEVGTPSSAKTVTLTNTGTLALKNVSISFSGPYSETNNCGASVAPNGGFCTITITFVPTAIGNQIGSVTVADNAADSPQAISMSGTGFAPTVSITSPTNGASLPNTTTVSVTTTEMDNVAITSVQFQLDGAPLNGQGPVTSPPYSVSWPAPLAIGTHSLTAVLSDTAGNSVTSAAVNVTVTDTAATANAGSITGSPNVSIPGNLSATTAYTGQTLTFNVAAIPTHGSVNIASNGGFSYTPTTGYTGTDAFTFNVTDAHGTVSNTATESISVVDTTPPTVAITSPTGGSATGTISVTASASDNVGVKKVQFQVNGVNQGAAVTSAPYTTSWNTASASNRSDTLTAVAYDAAGNTATSAGVIVSVPLQLPLAPTLIISSQTQGVDELDATLTWSTNSTPVTKYVLQSSGNASFTTPTQIYSGTATTESVSIEGGVRYYRVEACNTDGCGAWSAATEIEWNDDICNPDGTCRTNGGH